MLTTGPNLGLLDNGAFGERVYHETLRLYRALDGLVQAHVKSMSASSPPVSPQEGDSYIVPAGATGDWAASVGKVARWTARDAVVEPKWEYFSPHAGWEFSVDDLDINVRFDGTTWVGCSFVVSDAAPDDGDGRPDGTIYFQVT